MALLEEKIAMQRHIQAERRAKLNVLDFLEEQDGVDRKAEREALTEKMEKELQNLEWVYLDKEAQLEKELGQSALERQNK